MENNSAGNTVSRHRAASGKLPFLMFCDKEILYHGFLCFASIMVTVTQATVLNFFIIAFFRGYYHQVSLIRKFDEFLTFIFDLLCEVGKVSKIRQIETFIKSKSIQNTFNVKKSQLILGRHLFPIFGRFIHCLLYRRLICHRLPLHPP